MTITEKLETILRLSEELQADAARAAKKAKTRQVARFFEGAFSLGTVIGNIQSPMGGFRHAIERARAFEERLEKGE